MTDIELIKSKLDIVDVISSYVPNVTRAGANFRALCPFHNEKSPSFMINPSLQIYKCFGCGKAGDVISFIEEIERVEFPEALKISAEKAGVELTGKTMAKNEKLEQEKKDLIEANSLTAKYYNYILQSHNLGKPGRDYAQKRKIDGERIMKFMVGYAPENKYSLKKFLISKGFKEKDLVKWGLLVERNGQTIDKFRNRLMQTIFNVRGDVAGFSGRYIGTSKEAPKYLNSPETLIYKKNEMLYGLFNAKEALRKEKFGILVEGNIDILSSHRVGVKNIVAPLGTAFTKNQAMLLKRYVDEIYFSLDTDNAGTKALIRDIEILEDIGLKHKVIDLTGYQDADELICKRPEEWPERIKNAKDSLEYLMIKLQDGLDLGTADGKKKFSTLILPVLSSVRDEISKRHYAREIAALVEVPEDTILKMASSQKKSQLDLKEDENPVKIQRKRNELEEFYLALLLQGLHEADPEVTKEWFDNEINQKIFELIKQNPSGDLSALESQMNEQEKEAFEPIVMMDISGIKDQKKELNKIRVRLKKDYLKREILKLRAELKKEPEDNKVLNKLNNLMKEISKKS